MTTVKQLREKLEQLPDDMPILTYDGYGGYHGQCAELDVKIGEYGFYPCGFNHCSERSKKMHPDVEPVKFCLID